MMGTYYGMPFMWVFPLVFIVLIIWSVNQFSGKTNQVNDKNDVIDPEQILKLRYANGEISEKEYSTMLTRLNL